MVNTEIAQTAVAACRYPPKGNRGCGTRRAVGYGSVPFDDYLKISEHEPLVIVQIEHIEAVRNLDAILRTPGLGSVCIGPYDLSGSMGKLGQVDDPEVVKVIEESAPRPSRYVCWAASVRPSSHAPPRAQLTAICGDAYRLFKPPAGLLDEVRRSRANDCRHDQPRSGELPDCGAGDFVAGITQPRPLCRSDALVAFAADAEVLWFCSNPRITPGAGSPAALPAHLPQRQRTDAVPVEAFPRAASGT